MVAEIPQWFMGGRIGREQDKGDKGVGWTLLGGGRKGSEGIGNTLGSVGAQYMCAKFHHRVVV